MAKNQLDARVILTKNVWSFPLEQRRRPQRRIAALRIPGLEVTAGFFYADARCSYRGALGIEFLGRAWASPNEKARLRL